MRSDEGGELVALLEVHREARVSLRSNLGEAIDVRLAVHCDADDVCPGLVQDLDLPQRGLDVLGASRSHALHRDGGLTADGEVADVDRACLALGDHDRSILPASGGGGSPRG